MVLIIIIAIIVLIVLSSKGVFKKPALCQACGAQLKGTKQIWFGEIDSQFVLCKNCADRIHPQIRNYAKDHWNYFNYTDYLSWEAETWQERSQFSPTYVYGYVNQVMVDTERGLFCITTPYVNNGLIFRFADLNDYQIDFEATDMKDGFLNTKVKGSEFIMVELSRPAVLLEEIINTDVSYTARQKGFLSSKYEYCLSDEFSELIREFTLCIYIEQQKRNASYQQQNYNIDELDKALALFMFDSMDSVTEENLKKQRNMLIKAFHPDNNESNDTYSQKINTAYDVLYRAIKNR